MNSSKRGARHSARLLVGAALAASLVGCGGGGGQIEPFVPVRIMAFGDEISVITDAGKKYSVNALDASTGALDCKGNPNWVQTLASKYGTVFPQCNPDKVANPIGRLYAQPGAKVADVRFQITQHLSKDSFGAKDLATLLAGTNDLLELYLQYPGKDVATLTAAAGERGKAIAQEANRIVAAGGRVVISTLPDLSLSDLAVAAVGTTTEADRRALLKSMVDQFNTQLRLTIVNDGRFIGLITADEISRQPMYYGIADNAKAACLSTAALPDCTTKTVINGSDGKPITPSAYFWADKLWPGVGGHAALGNAAFRASSNPF